MNGGAVQTGLGIGINKRFVEGPFRATELAELVLPVSKLEIAAAG
jgi:hypothetical protein